MRTKMSSRRALINAGIISSIPLLIFLLSNPLKSENICNSLSDKPSIPLASRNDFKISCNKLLYNNNLAYFPLTFLASTLINWPLIRWLDDRQWYREWLKED